MTEKFDAFFVGDGSAKLLQNEPTNESQLLQLFANVSPEGTSMFVLENDLGRFGREVIVPDNPEEVFITYKNVAYRTFDFLGIKSKWFGDAPIRERDLVLSEDDRYILNYLTKMEIDKGVYAEIARLLAYQEMGVRQARYHTDCKCPICKVYDGKVFDVAFLIRLLSGGDYLTHCVYFELTPVICREFYQGPIEELNRSFYYKGILFTDCPIELSWSLSLELERGEGTQPISQICFVDMVEFLKEVEDSAGIVVYYKDGILNVHNSWVNDLGPIDFLRMWLEPGQAESVDVELLKDCETFFFCGKRVAKFNGSYWDIETGKLVK